MTQSLLRLLFVLALFQIGFICCAEKQEKADIIAGAPIMWLPESVVNEIVEFVGAKNNLWKAHSYFKRVMVDCFPIHRFVAKIMDIPELADYSGIKSEILDLLKVTKFESLEDKEQYLINEVKLYSNYQSIKNHVIRFSLDSISRFDGEDFGLRMLGMFSVFCDYTDLEMMIKFLRLLDRVDAPKYLYGLLMNWTPEQQADFFEQIVNHSDGKGILRFLIELETLSTLIPYLIKHNVPEPWWIDILSSFNPVQIKELFLHFPCYYHYSLSEEEFERFPQFFLRIEHLLSARDIHFITLLLRVLKKDADSITAASLAASQIRSEGMASLDLLAFSIVYGAVELQNAILEVDSGLLDTLFASQIFPFGQSASSIFVDFITARAVALFLGKSREFLNRPEWNHFSFFVSNFIERLFELYEVKRATMHESLFCFEFEAVLVDQKYEGFLMPKITFYFPNTTSILRVMMRSINTQNIDVLNLITKAYSCGKFDGILSVSIFRALQESDEFRDRFMALVPNGHSWGLTWEDAEVFNRPIDPILCISKFSPYRGIFKLTTVDQFERLLLLSEREGGFQSRTLLDIYFVLKDENNSYEQLSIPLFYQRNRQFFHLWVLSSRWKKLSYIYETDILDYLEVDFPRRIRKIRLLRAHKLAQTDGFNIYFSKYLNND